MLIALFSPLTGFSQNNGGGDGPANVSGDSLDKGTLLPVKVGSEIWYAMPFSRLAKISNDIASLDSLRQVSLLVPLLDSSLSTCKQVNSLQKQEINSFEALMKSYDIEVGKQDSIIMNQAYTIEKSDAVIKELDGKYQKERRKNKGKNILIICGTAIGLLLGILIAAAIK